MANSVKSSYRKIYLIFLTSILLAVIAFWKSYFGILNNLPETATFKIHLHAVTMFIWLLMLLSQAWLIRIKMFTIHRWIGRFSYVFAPFIIWTGLVLIQEMLNRVPNEVPLDTARLNVFSFGQLISFLVTWGLAIKYRKNTPKHMRFMISTVFAVGLAIVFRIFLFWIPGFNSVNSALFGSLVAMLSLLLILIGLDWKKGIKKSVYWVVFTLISLTILAYWTITKTEWYMSFCEWYSQLPKWIFFG